MAALGAGLLGGQPGVFLAYACWRTTQFALGRARRPGVTSALQIPCFYPVVSMTVGYYFITLHFLQGAVRRGARVARRGAGGPARGAGRSLVGGRPDRLVVWAVLWLLLAAGASPLVALGVLFVALTLAGTPIVFMLAIVGIVALFSPVFLGLTFYPSTDPFVPFSVSQFTMGLSGGSELLVILMFLIVAEVLNSSGMSDAPDRASPPRWSPTCAAGWPTSASSPRWWSRGSRARPRRTRRS